MDLLDDFKDQIVNFERLNYDLKRKSRKFITIGRRFIRMNDDLKSSSRYKDCPMSKMKF